MADSQKLKIKKALTAHFEAMNPTLDDPATLAPYEIDLRGRVYRGRLTFTPDDVATQPILSILEATRMPNPVAVGEKLVRKSAWQLLIQGFVPFDKLNPTDPADLLLAQVEQRLSRLIAVNGATGDGKYPEFRLDGLIDSLAIGEGIVRPSDPQVSPTAFFYLPVAVELVTNLEEPYAD